MERRPEIGLSSYDRFFPNQDTLPKGGFGNLIALPLQKRPRESGNSIFLDEDFAPYPDQWAFLSTIRRIDRAAVENIVRDAEARDRIVGVRHALAEEDEPAPWTMPPSRRRKEPPIAGPLPANLELVRQRRNLHCKRRSFAQSAQSPPSAGCVSEPRILQSPGDAPADLRQASDHCLRRRPSASHQFAARLSGGRARAAIGIEDQTFHSR